MSVTQTLNPIQTCPAVHSSEWMAVYKEFERVAYSILENPNLITMPGAEAHIEKAIEALWAQHKGEPAWDAAYYRWCEGHQEREE